MVWLYVGIVFILFIVYLIIKSTIKGKLMIAYQQENYEMYYKLLDSSFAKICIPAYNREYMRLNGLIEQGIRKKADSQFELLFKVRKNKSQTEDLLQKSMQYYVNEKDSKSCHKLLNYMKKCQLDEQIIKEATYIVDILVDKKTSYIEELEQNLNSADEQKKIVYYYLLQVQYENLNNNKQAQKYEELLNTQK